MFINEMKKTLNNEFNYSETENGALGYRTTGKNLLDINFQVASLRGASEEQIINKFIKAFYENKLLAIKWLFYVRDIREGVGERRLFRVIIKYLGNNNPEIIENLIQYIPEYGRWDDILCLLNTKCKNKVIEIIKKQLSEDVANMYSQNPISLLAKWLPNDTSKSVEKREYAKLIMKELEYTPKNYNNLLSALRRYLDIVEIKMSSNKWNEINYSNVPSRANLLYNNAFLRHDEERRVEFLNKVKLGETKINSSVLFPQDIVARYKKAFDETLESLWKALPDLVKEDNKTIVVADGSGSMYSSIGNSRVTALDVANSLAIYFSERCSGEFKDKYITFSTRPQLVNFENCQSLKDKINFALNYSEVSDTNIEAVFDLILTTAINGQMKQEELPQNILIISDMEFNSAISSPIDGRLFTAIKNKYQNAGYKMPRLVFWNVNSRTQTIPIIENELGVALISGFSVNLVKMCMSGKTDAYECLVEQLMSKRYEKIII